MIAAHGLTVRKSNRLLLDAVEFEAAPGTLTAIVGPNGAGKSTLLKVLSGDLAPDSGKVHILDRSLSSWPRKELARRRAVLPQSSSLTFAFRVRDVVRLGRLPFGVNPCDADLVQSCLAEVGLMDRAAELYPNLSGGEQKRVQYARILAQIHDAKESGSGVLLLDEPTANLDPAHGLAVLAHARELARRGLTVVAVVHDINLATPFTDRFVALLNGQVCFAGGVEESMTAVNLQNLFGVKAIITRHPVYSCPTVHFVAA